MASKAWPYYSRQNKQTIKDGLLNGLNVGYLPVCESLTPQRRCIVKSCILMHNSIK